MTRFSLVFLATTLAFGCSLLEPKPNRTRYFLLVPTTTSAPSSPQVDLAVGIGPLRLPDYLRRSDLVRRSGDNQLRFDESERWAEPLDQSLPRVLAQDVANLLGTTTVTRVPGPVNLKLNIEVPIEVLCFEADRDGVVHLHARWALKAPRGDKFLYGHEAIISEAAGSRDSVAVVAAMSRAVTSLAGEIAEAVKQQDAAKATQPAEPHRPHR